MPRPEVVRRIKSHSAATGYVYQYYFYEVEKKRRGRSQGTEYVYMVSVDRHHVFPVRIFVQLDALEEWSARTGQKLTGTEEYAVAKMRLFQAFDEIEAMEANASDLVVDGSNLETLLSQLDL
jgi:guanylate kinase